MVLDHLEGFLGDVVPSYEKTRAEYGELEYSYNCRNYISHSRDKTGRIGEPRTSTGPSVDGFRLRLTPLDELGIGAYGGGRIFDVRPNGYFLTYSNTYQLPNDAGYVVMSYDFGVRTNPGVLTAIRAFLSAIGKELHKPVDLEQGDMSVVADVVSRVIKSHSLETTESESPTTWT